MPKSQQIWVGPFMSTHTHSPDKSKIMVQSKMSLFCVDSLGVAQVIRRSTHLSGCIQSLLPRVATRG